MSSRHLEVPVSPMRPSEFNEDATTALQYLASVLHIAYDEVQLALKRFAPSRGDKWVVRTQLKHMCHPLVSPDTAALLSAHGIKVSYNTQRDLFWFRVKGCDHTIRLVARPDKSPEIPSSGVFRQESLAMDGEEFGDDTHLYLMMHTAGNELLAVTLALAANNQKTWVYKGPGILDEVLVFDAAAAVVAPLPREDEAYFREQLPARSEQDATAATEADSDERTTDDAQHGGENAIGT